MSWVQADLNRLDAAIATGALKVAYGNGTMVEYRSMADMMAARNLIAGSLQSIPQSRSTLAEFSSGF